METTLQTTIQAPKVLYTAYVHTIGGREHGVAKSSDGRLEIKLSPPGTDGVGTNPEQLFAAGWSACFEGAIGVAARRMHVSLPKGPEIDAEVDLASDKGNYILQARLNIKLEDLDREVARQIVDAAKETCPYSLAIKGNVKVEYNLV